MDLGQELLAAQMAPEAGLNAFSRDLDLGWVKRALQNTNAASLRRRKLPAEYVVWLVVGMALFRDRCIEDVVRHLDLVQPDPDEPEVRRHVTPGAIVQARDRLGDE